MCTKKKGAYVCVCVISLVDRLADVTDDDIKMYKDSISHAHSDSDDDGIDEDGDFGDEEEDNDEGEEESSDGGDEENEGSYQNDDDAERVDRSHSEREKDVPAPGKSLIGAVKSKKAV